MNGLENLLQQLAGGGGNTSDWLWCIEQSALQRHIASRQPLSLHRIHSQPTAEDIMEVSGGVAIIHVHGVMMKEVGWSDEVSTPAIEQALLQAAADADVKSALVLFDTPGGSTAGLVQAAEAMAALAAVKPVVAQSEGMIASAGYFLASRAHKIYAERGHLIGSIGTRLMVYDFSKLFENIGVVPVSIDTGPLKSTGAFGTAVTDEQQAYLQKIVDGFQAEFRAAVVAGRGFDNEQYEAVATGAVHHVAEARQLGLIDGIRTKAQTLAAMPTRKPRSTKTRSETMSTNDNEPKAATLQELKRALPSAESDFLLAQLEADATIQDATSAWADHLTAENERLVKEKEEADAARAEAEKKLAAGGTSGKTGGKKSGQTVPSQFGTQGSAGEEVNQDELDTDYVAMARRVQAERQCTWREACQIVKRRHPEARAAFIGKVLPT